MKQITWNELIAKHPIKAEAAIRVHPTKCARCMNVADTPIRNDKLGGYICLTCIDGALNQLLNAQERPEYIEANAIKFFPIECAPTDNKVPLLLATFSDGKINDIDTNGSWEYWEESWEMAHINGYCWMSDNGRINEPTHWAYQNIVAIDFVGE